MALSLSSSHPLHASQGLAADLQSLQQLKRGATQSDPAATKEAARQFESLFMREMIKSMREATMKSGLLDGAHGDLGADLLDQQLSVQMSGLPGGLSETIARQLAQAMGVQPAASGTPSTLSLGGVRQTTTPSTSQATTTPAPAGRDAFVQHLSGTAERVAQESGIPSAFMLGQAGHETGWGKSAIKKADGSDSFNVFGIKAGKGWTGKVAEVTTTEYIDGKPRKVTAKFRAYDSYEESFRDYARLIKESPRYEKAESVAKTGSAQAYASALQKAGYATDPEYARKLSGAINSALRAQRALA